MFMLIRKSFGVCSSLLALSFDGVLVRKRSLHAPSQPFSNVTLKLVLRKTMVLYGISFDVLLAFEGRVSLSNPVSVCLTPKAITGAITRTV